MEYKELYSTEIPRSTDAETVELGNAIGVISNRLRCDPELREVWRANIACMVMDEQGEQESIDMRVKDNRSGAANRVLRLLFGV